MVQRFIEEIIFWLWCIELNFKGWGLYGPGPITWNTGKECWRMYFDDGYCPEDALGEDTSYADE